MRRWAIFAVLLLMLGSLAACVESAEDDSGDDGDDSAAAASSPTPEPTEAPDPTATPEPDPTATPSPEPTATATAEPDPTATPDDGDGDGEEHVIDIQDSFFDPEEIEIAPGDTVTWVNNGDLVHTSTLDPEIAQDPDNAVRPDGAETWDSGDMQPGDEFSVMLDVPGEYVYFCRPHEALGMVGTIVVTEE